MGYDYYIYKLLKINHKSGIYYIKLSREGGYIFYEPDCDSDDEQYETERIKAHNQHLQVNTKPVLVYQNNDFLNDNLRAKYVLKLESKLKHENINKEDIIDIYKIEDREWA
jgi:hypothetical protein